MGSPGGNCSRFKSSLPLLSVGRGGLGAWLPKEPKDCGLDVDWWVFEDGWATLGDNFLAKSGGKGLASGIKSRGASLALWIWNFKLNKQQYNTTLRKVSGNGSNALSRGFLGKT